MGDLVPLYKLDPFNDPIAAVRDRLLKSFGYEGRDSILADDVIASIRALAPELRESFVRFWNTGHFDKSLSVGDFTLGEVISRALFTPLAAYLVLSDLRTDPERAGTRLRRKIHQLEHPSVGPGKDAFSYASESPVKLPGWE